MDHPTEEDKEDCPDSLLRVRLRDLPEFFLQTTGNLLVWSSHSLITKILTWAAVLPVLLGGLVAGLKVDFPRCTIRRRSAPEYVQRLPFFMWPAIFVGLVAYQYFNWLPHAFAVFLFSCGVLAIWFLLSTVIFVVPSRAFSLQGSTAMAIFVSLAVLFVAVFPKTLQLAKGAAHLVLNSPFVVRNYPGVTLAVLVGFFSFIYFRTAAGSERTIASGKDLRNLVVVKDALIANGVTAVFAFKNFRDAGPDTNLKMIALAGAGVLLLFGARFLCHIAQATEESNGAGRVEVLDARGSSQSGRVVKTIRPVDRIAYIAYLGSWVAVMWSILLYLYYASRRA
jgi:hypothetical protein